MRCRFLAAAQLWPSDSIPGAIPLPETLFVSPLQFSADEVVYGK